MAVAKAVESLKKREIERIVLSRPAVEAGERLGFLPGDMKEKVDPYLRPLYDALYDMMPADKVDRMLVSGEIEIAPLAFMRGRTLSASYVIIDEAQNTTPVQMKMVLTRLGQDSRMVITGDLSQIDLPDGQPSGLADAVKRLDSMSKVSGSSICRARMSSAILLSRGSSRHMKATAEKRKRLDRSAKIGPNRRMAHRADRPERSSRYYRHEQDAPGA